MSSNYYVQFVISLAIDIFLGDCGFVKVALIGKKTSASLFSTVARLVLYQDNERNHHQCETSRTICTNYVMLYQLISQIS